MKTKNNVQKTILRSVAVVTSFVLISYTVSAQEFWKKLLTNSSLNEIAIAMVETSDGAKKAESSEKANQAQSTVNEVFEPVLKLEYWMTSENYFENSAAGENKKMENLLILEKRILNNNFKGNNCETEQPLELEDWMTSDKFGES